MSNQQGVVKWAGSKDIKGRTYFSFNLVDIDGFFRCGTRDPNVNKGDAIEFTFEVDPKWGNQVDTKTVKVVDSAPEVAPAPLVQPASKVAVGRDDYWANKELADVSRQKIISLQAATNTATSIVTAALAADVLPLPTKKAEKFDALVFMIHELADFLVVRYTTAPAHVDLLVLDDSMKEVEDNKNYGGEMDDE